LHILTKIFIVLTSLLSVALVPLVMLNTANEETFKKRWLDEQAKVKEAVFAKDAAQRLQEASSSSAMAESAALRTEIEKLKGELNTARESSLQISSVLAGQRGELDVLQASNRVLAESNKIGNETTSLFSKELADLRERLVAAQRDNVRLDEAVATLTSENEVFKASVRQLKEELRQTRDEKDRAQSRVSQYVAAVGDLPGGSAPGATRDVVAKVPADRSISASILGVTRGADRTLAEINAGSRDGVQPGWTMMIADGNRFIGNLRITHVDVNRSVGVVELENPAERGEVKAGLRVMSRKGE
jgi:hypothetical protein